MMEKIIENKEAFVFYESMYKQLMTLYNRGKMQEYIELSKAIMEYGLYGVIPEEDNDVWLFGFEAHATAISIAKNRYEQAKINGAKGGRPVKYSLEKMLKLKSEGKSIPQIASIMECSQRTVRDKIAKFNNGEYGDYCAEYREKTGNNLKEKEYEYEYDYDYEAEQEYKKEISSMGFAANAAKHSDGTSSVADENINNPKDNKLDF